MAVVWPPYGESGSGVATVNGDAGPDVVLTATELGAATQSDLDALDARVVVLENAGA